MANLRPVGRALMQMGMSCMRGGQQTATLSQARFNSSEADACPVSSFNDWDPLEEVIVGRPEGARVPRITTEIRGVFNPGSNDVGDQFLKLAGQPFPKEIVDKAKVEVAEFVKILEMEGVKVRRPDEVDWNELGDVKTPDFVEGGFVNSCPRDSLLVVGDEILEAPMSWRCRYFINRSFHSLCNEYFTKGATWTAAPRPVMNEDLYNQDFPFDDVEERKKCVHAGKFVVKNTQPCWDAADITRCGKDLFVQLSHVTNPLGIQWLKRHLGPKGFNVHTFQFDDPFAYHIDATFVVLRPGLALQNPTRPCLHIDYDKNKYDDYFKKNGWNVIEAPQPVYKETYPAFSSAWLSINMLSLDENRVICDKDQIPMHKELEKHGITCIKADLGNAHWLNGSFHCWTLDVRRRGGLQSYFN